MGHGNQKGKVSKDFVSGAVPKTSKQGMSAAYKFIALATLQSLFSCIKSQKSNKLLCVHRDRQSQCAQKLGRNAGEQIN